MNCPYCGSELDTGFRCLKCGYKWQNGIKQPKPSTAEKYIVAVDWAKGKDITVLNLAEKTHLGTMVLGQFVDSNLLAEKDRTIAELTAQLENSAQLIKDYKHFIEYDIERLYYIIETAEREETENENNMSVWSVGYETDYDSHEQMTALEERIGNQALSRLVAELKKGVKLRKIGTDEAKARLKELEEQNDNN